MLPAPSVAISPPFSLTTHRPWRYGYMMGLKTILHILLYTFSHVGVEATRGAGSRETAVFS